MIIESAFYRLPELWVSDPDKLSGELDVASDFKLVISEQLSANGIDTKPSIGEHYPINKTSGRGPKLKADLYVNTGRVPDRWSSRYVIRGETWIEAKYFRQDHRRASFALGKNDLKDIARDLLRLCVLVKEGQGSIRDRSRYFCAVFYASSYSKSGVAYSPLDCTSEPPPWLAPLLSPGEHGNTTLKFIEATDLPAPVELTLKTTTYAFDPLPTDESLWLYWGRLVRIFGFTIRFDGSDDVLVYESHGYWSGKQGELQEKIANILIRAKLVQGG
jgi:hypothetical protein